jgi:hypothetical protein
MEVVVEPSEKGILVGFMNAKEVSFEELIGHKYLNKVHGQ